MKQTSKDNQNLSKDKKALEIVKSPSELIMDIINTYDDLIKVNEQLAVQLRKENKQGLPILLPTYTGPEEGICEAAIESLTQTWKPQPGEIIVSEGLICASKSAIDIVKHLESVKLAFKKAINSLRKKSAEKKTHIDRLIERVLKEEGKRDKKMTLALKRIGINQLDLLRCYANIRILEENLESISWTWATKHTAVDPTDYVDAVKMADSLSNEDTKKIALKLLGDLPPGEKLAYKKKLPNQLRANLVYYENDERKRKAVTISGIVLCRESKLPKYIWRDDPDLLEISTARLTRHDVGISPTPYIKALNLYRYLKYIK